MASSPRGSAAPAQDGETLFTAHLSLIDEVIRSICRRNHCRREDAEEFASRARLKFIEEDYAVLRQFAGRSSLRTYIVTVLQRLFVDFRRQHWGVWRPSAEGRRLGDVAVRLDVLINRDGVSLEEAVEILVTNEQVGASREELYAMAERLPSRRGRRFESDKALEEVPVPQDAAEWSALEREHEERRTVLRAALAEVLEGLSAEDREILRLRFWSGVKVVSIAVSLGCEAKLLYRRIDRLYDRLREAMERQGVGRVDVAELVGNAAWESEDLSGDR